MRKIRSPDAVRRDSYLSSGSRQHVDMCCGAQLYLSRFLASSIPTTTLERYSCVPFHCAAQLTESTPCTCDVCDQCADHHWHLKQVIHPPTHPQALATMSKEEIRSYVTSFKADQHPHVSVTSCWDLRSTFGQYPASLFCDTAVLDDGGVEHAGVTRLSAC